MPAPSSTHLDVAPDESPVETSAYVDTSQPLLTVLIPAYNEEATMASVLQAVLAVPYNIQVVVVDDGSQDRTRDFIEDFQHDSRVEAFFHERNRGKGAAIRTGLAHARGHLCIIQDADLEYDPRDYPPLIAPLLAGTATVVYGSRYTGQDRKPWRWLRYGVVILNSAVFVLFGVKLTDEATCYKVMPTELLRALDLKCERFEFCSEVTAKLCRARIPITEVAVTYRPRTAAQGKKLRWTDGWSALTTLWRWRHWNMPQLVAEKWRARHLRIGHAAGVPPRESGPSNCVEVPTNAAHGSYGLRPPGAIVSE